MKYYYIVLTQTYCVWLYKHLLGCDLHSLRGRRLTCSEGRFDPSECDVAEALMSLSELELFEHATHLGGERPDGMRYEGVWGSREPHISP